MPHFDPVILEPAPEARAKILAVLQAALEAVDPYAAVKGQLQRDGERLHIGARTYSLDDYEAIYVVGAGKAGAPMSRAVIEALGDRVTDGVVVVKTGHGHEQEYPHAMDVPSSSHQSANRFPHQGNPLEQKTLLERIPIVEASHPVPDRAGVEAGYRILGLARQARENDLFITLLSGGGSALLVAPAAGLTLDDLQQMTDALLASGATINEVNCLRKHCSAIKGGQLARAAYPATQITLALSDVIGSPPDVIASGPTVPDASTWQDAWQIVRRYELEDKLPTPVVGRLRAGLDGELPDTPKVGDELFARTQTVVVADNRRAALAAQNTAQELGFNTLLLTTYLEGEAAEVGKVAAALGKEIHALGAPLAAPACVILGGETTVTLGANPGLGGRNQELALSAALALHAEWPGITVVSLATDGTDGPTDSAGGMADSETVARGWAANLDAEEHRHRHNAYPYLRATRDLLLTGPTQTNVNDLVFVFVEN